MASDHNYSRVELEKFGSIAHEWWDPRGKFRTLHVVNPLRLHFIENIVELKNRHVLDIGCGGGLLCEAMAAKSALVTGIDASDISIQIARDHLIQTKLAVNYMSCTVEQFAVSCNQQFDVISCMEMLEHVPDPVAIIETASRLLKPGGHFFLSTINRNLRSYLETVIGAEYLLNLIPAGTHDYSQYIRPAELCRWLRTSGLDVVDIKGIKYIPFIHVAHLSPAPTVNYIVHASMPV